MESTEVRTDAGDDRLDEVYDLATSHGCDRLGDLIHERLKAVGGWLHAGKESRDKVARSGMGHIRGCAWCRSEWAQREERKRERAEWEEYDRGYGDAVDGRERDPEGGDRYSKGWEEGCAHVEWKRAQRESKSIDDHSMTMTVNLGV